MAPAAQCLRQSYYWYQTSQELSPHLHFQSILAGSQFPYHPTGVFHQSQDCQTWILGLHNSISFTWQVAMIPDMCALHQQAKEQESFSLTTSPLCPHIHGSSSYCQMPLLMKHTIVWNSIPEYSSVPAIFLPENECMMPESTTSTQALHVTNW